MCSKILRITCMKCYTVVIVMSCKNRCSITKCFLIIRKLSNSSLFSTKSVQENFLENF